MNRHEEIEKIAYELYEKSGRVDGRSAENWFEAERLLIEREGKKAGRAGAGAGAGRASAVAKPAAKTTAARKAPARKPRKSV